MGSPIGAMGGAVVRGPYDGRGQLCRTDLPADVIIILFIPMPCSLVCKNALRREVVRAWTFLLVGYSGSLGVIVN